MEFFDLMRDRYSVRKYADKPVEQEKLNKILAAGAAAPTAKNLQPQRTSSKASSCVNSPASNGTTASV